MYGVHQEMRQVPTLCTDVKSSSGGIDYNNEHLTFCCLGDRPNWSVAKRKRWNTICSGHSGLLHEVGRSRSSCIHHAYEDQGIFFIETLFINMRYCIVSYQTIGNSLIVANSKGSVTICKSRRRSLLLCYLKLMVRLR